MSGVFYDHERFSDVYFLSKQCGFYGKRWKLKAVWWSKRGYPLGVITKLELNPEKAREFYEYSFTKDQR